ncbi:MAG: hypothetical protein WBA43_05150 [Elainellaceae cyanobacterium]
MNLNGLIPYALAVVALGGVALAQSSPAPVSPPEQPAVPQAAAAPQRLTINVTVADPEDLKVAEGDRIEGGQLIADRGQEKRRLEAQKSQLALALQRLQSSTITAPLPPAQPPAIAPPTYLEQEAAIDRAKATVDLAELAIANKQQELTYLAELPSLDPLVMEHEQAKLAELQRNHTAAVREYQLAMGKRSTAEYQHSVTVAADVTSRNQAVMSYQEQWAEYEQRLRDKDYQISQTQLRLDEVDYAIAKLAVVRSPYAGRIRRVRWVGQNPDGSLGVELTLLIRDGGSTVSGQLDGVPGGVDEPSDSQQPGDTGY